MTKRPSTEYKTYLSEEELPTHYYNVRADMPTDHAPMLNPATLEPVTVDDLSPVFATELARQELNATDRFIPIPDPVRDFYRMYRPSPLVHAKFFEEALGTPASHGCIRMLDEDIKWMAENCLADTMVFIMDCEEDEALTQALKPPAL